VGCCQWAPGGKLFGGIDSACAGAAMVTARQNLTGIASRVMGHRSRRLLERDGPPSQRPGDGPPSNISARPPAPGINLNRQ